MAWPVQSQRGQASVELIAAIPALLIVIALAVQAALGAWALWNAQNAARAGSRAAAIGGDAERAARSALPDELRSGASVQVGGGVRVSVGAPRVAAPMPSFAAQAGARLPGAGDAGR